MPRIRNRGGVSNRSNYDWPERAAPSSVHWMPDSVIKLPPAMARFPDIPLNPQHRYCTPPPLDPKYIDPPVEYDDFPQYLDRPPYPGDFEELTGGRPPIPVPGSRSHPIEILDNDPPENTRQGKRRQVEHADENVPRRSPRTPSRPAPFESASSSSSPSSSLRSATAGSSPTTPTAAPSSHRTSPRKAAAPTRRSPRTTTGTGSSSRGPTFATAAPHAAPAAHGFQPPNSSPLRNVAYRAPSQRPLSPTPVPAAGAQHQLYIPRRKHSTGSISASSASSYDSDSSDSDAESYWRY